MLAPPPYNGLVLATSAAAASPQPPAVRATAATRRGRRLALALFLAAALLTAARVVQVAQLPEHGLFTKYTAAAADLRAGRLSATRLADLSPLYLAVIAGAEALGASAATVVGVQVAALGLVALLAGAIAWRWGGPAAGAGAAAAVLCCRMALVNATDLEPEILVLLLETAGLWLLARQRPRPLAAGLALGAAAAARPTALALAAVALAWLVWSRRETHWPRRMAAAIPLLLGLALPLGAAAAAVRVITGGWLLMNPGTVLYEGWNPRATGLAGEVPTVVTDVEGTLKFPDALHEAYRTVTSRAIGHDASARAVNRYWTARAVAWVESAPGAAARLLVRKLHAVVSSYAAWDLSSAALTERELPAVGWLPFGLLAAAALAGAAAGRRYPVVLLLAGAVAAGALAPLLFYASARLRLPTLPGVAVLAGLACGVGQEAWQAGRKRQVAAAVLAVVLAGLALSVPLHAEREDRHGWDLTLDGWAALRHSERAATAQTALSWRTRAALDLAEPMAAPATVAAAVRQSLTGELPPARRFDLAVAAARAGDWTTSDAVLAGLAAEGYRPVRGWALCSSIAYHRGRARLHLGDRTAALTLARRAVGEAPGDPEVLALAARLEGAAGNRAAAERLDASLDRLHDPFTAARARGLAARDAGDDLAAGEFLRWLYRMLPELRH